VRWPARANTAIGRIQDIQQIFKITASVGNLASAVLDGNVSSMVKSIASIEANLRFGIGTPQA
jgi:hypothetical protein